MHKRRQIERENWSGGMLRRRIRLREAPLFPAAQHVGGDQHVEESHRQHRQHRVEDLGDRESERSRRPQRRPSPGHDVHDARGHGRGTGQQATVHSERVVERKHGRDDDEIRGMALTERVGGVGGERLGVFPDVRRADDVSKR